MSYNFYNVGIPGVEVERRLDLLQDIDVQNDGGVATKTDAKSIINTLYGQNIKIDDIFKDNTPMSVRVSSKNLIPFPYSESSESIVRKNGLTFTILTETESAAEMKGQIGIRGTLNSDVTEASYKVFHNNENAENNLQLSGPATFSCEFQYTNNACRIEITTIKLNGTSVTETITQDKTYIVFEDVKCISQIILVVNNTATLETAIIRPQLEIGKFPTTYAPYINDFNGIKLYKVNEDLLHLSSDEEEKIIVGNGSSINFSTAFYKLPPIIASSGTFKVSVDFKKLEFTVGNLSRGFVAVQLRRTNGKLGMKTVYGYGDEGHIEIIYTLDATYNNGFEILLYGNASAANLETYCEFSNIKVTVANNDIDFSDDDFQTETKEYIFTGSNVITDIPASYPTTSFYTNSFSVLLEVQYYADFKKYIDNNYSRLPTSQIIDAGRITDYI